MMWKTILTAGVSLCLTAAVYAAFPEPAQSQRRPVSAAVQAMAAETLPAYRQCSYTDGETGKTISYNLYLPASYDPAKSYPLVLFIGDAGTVGGDVARPVSQGNGGMIWAAPAEQARHPVLVLVPQYPEVILDDHGGHTMTEYVELTARLVRHIASSYAVDQHRIYGTGQSMGCMTVMYLAAQHPDLFAATLLVDGQWDIAALGGLVSQTFLYVAAGGDDKALGGLEDVRHMLDQKNIAYGYIPSLNAKEALALRNASAAVMLDQGYRQNFLVWTKGSVLPYGGMGSEHMYSFDYPYQLRAVRDWLFAQKRL